MTKISTLYKFIVTNYRYKILNYLTVNIIPTYRYLSVRSSTTTCVIYIDTISYCIQSMPFYLSVRSRRQAELWARVNVS